MTEQSIDHVFDAPRDEVWKGFANPELLAHWYGPGVDTIIHELDLRPGGLWRNEMKWGDTSDLSRMQFREVDAPNRLVWVHASADADWNETANPMMPDWPRRILASVTLEDAGPGTNLRLAMDPIDPSPDEAACFAAAWGNMAKGWAAGFALLDRKLAEG